MCGWVFPPDNWGVAVHQVTLGSHKLQRACQNTSCWSCLPPAWIWVCCALLLAAVMHGRHTMTARAQLRADLVDCSSERYPMGDPILGHRPMFCLPRQSKAYYSTDLLGHILRYVYDGQAAARGSLLVSHQVSPAWAGIQPSFFYSGSKHIKTLHAALYMHCYVIHRVSGGGVHISPHY